ncbi:hypothetical protein STEG23_024035 [Scotinomys teguina]
MQAGGIGEGWFRGAIQCSGSGGALQSNLPLPGLECPASLHSLWQDYKLPRPEESSSAARRPPPTPASSSAKQPARPERTSTQPDGSAIRTRPALTPAELEGKLQESEPDRLEWTGKKRPSQVQCRTTSVCVIDDVPSHTLP